MDFERIDMRDRDAYDLSIYELVEKSKNEVTLFTRPRRFGKTITMKRTFRIP